MSVCPGWGRVEGHRNSALSLSPKTEPQGPDQGLCPAYSTTVDPWEKLEVLEKTYGEIEATVSRVLGREHKLPMDDLLPLLIYVVSRARWVGTGADGRKTSSYPVYTKHRTGGAEAQKGASLMGAWDRAGAIPSV